ncbi:hypothetical protein BBP40_002136 [Aspergillus hancockii]|nr:hypothetical protein BBP40_002136 [Aspergillus hancockii]
MARMLMLINRPVERFLQQSHNQSGILATYHTLQQDLRRHAVEIIPIARGTPSETVRKYLLQPLYVAGRCLVSANDRQSLLAILKAIDYDLGVFTGFRQKDLSEEWGIPYKVVESRTCL